MIRSNQLEIPEANLQETLPSKEADAAGGQKCMINDDLILSLQQQIEFQNKMIRYLEGGKMV